MTIVHHEYAANTKGRDFVVGDLHGLYDVLMGMLSLEGFDFEYDRLFSVGDIIDRGPDSLKCARLTAEPWFFPVLGNHEAMLLGVADGDDPMKWLLNGGRWGTELSLGVLQEAASLLRPLPHALTVELPDSRKVGITHAEFPRQNWMEIVSHKKDSTLKQSLMWSRTQVSMEDKDWTEGVVVTVHGHTPVDHPLYLGNALFIDTGAVYGRVLTVMKLEDAANGVPRK